MSGLATVDTTTAPDTTKRRRISKRMQQALALLATRGMTQCDAANKAGISEFHLSRELRKPQIQAFIAQKCRDSIQAGTLRASSRIVELIDADSEHVSLQASDRILTSEGILKSEQAAISVNVDVKAGFVLDLTEPLHMTHKPVIEAKPLKDKEGV